MYCTMQPQTVYIIAFMLWPPSAALPVNDFSSSFIWTLKKEIFFVFFLCWTLFFFLSVEEEKPKRLLRYCMHNETFWFVKRNLRKKKTTTKWNWKVTVLLAKATSGLKHFIFFKIKESCKVVFSFHSFTAPWPSRSSLPPLSLTVCAFRGAPLALGLLTPPSRDSSQLTCLSCLEPTDWSAC